MGSVTLVDTPAERLSDDQLDQFAELLMSHRHEFRARLARRVVCARGEDEADVSDLSATSGSSGRIMPTKNIYEIIDSLRSARSFVKANLRHCIRRTSISGRLASVFGADQRSNQDDARIAAKIEHILGAAKAQLSFQEAWDRGLAYEGQLKERLKTPKLQLYGKKHHSSHRVSVTVWNCCGAVLKWHNIPRRPEAMRQVVEVIQPRLWAMWLQGTSRSKSSGHGGEGAAAEQLQHESWVPRYSNLADFSSDVDCTDLFYSDARLMVEMEQLCKSPSRRVLTVSLRPSAADEIKLCEQAKVLEMSRDCELKEMGVRNANSTCVINTRTWITFDAHPCYWHRHVIGIERPIVELEYRLKKTPGRLFAERDEELRDLCDSVPPHRSIAKLGPERLKAIAQLPAPWRHERAGRRNIDEHTVAH